MKHPFSFDDGEYLCDVCRDRYVSRPGKCWACREQEMIDNDPMDGWQASAWTDDDWDDAESEDES